MKPKKILLLDDEPDIIRAVSMRLRDAGYEVITAADGYEGTQVAFGKKPDLVICDISMPAGNGHEVVRRLKESDTTWDIPIIFLTASSDLEDMKKAIDSKVANYITKPFKPEELLTTVEVIFSTRNMQATARLRL